MSLCFVNFGPAFQSVSCQSLPVSLLSGVLVIMLGCRVVFSFGTFFFC